MKAILVINMPENCVECPCEQHKICLVKGGVVESIDRPSWCPLKPIPKELVYEGYDSPNKQIGEAILQSEWGKKAKKNDAICIRSFSIGYNSCLEEITK